jgi:hypothetical protein
MSVENVDRGSREDLDRRDRRRIQQEREDEG